LKSAENITLDELVFLGDSFGAEKNCFMSYFYYNSAFKLAKDSSLAVTCGFKALRQSILADRVQESSLLKNQISARFGDLKGEAERYYQYHLVRRKDFTTLSAIFEQKAEDNSQLFLQAYSAFALGKARERDSLLSRIEHFPLQNEVENIRLELQSEQKLPHKSRFFSAAASAILPGSGQLYCGSLFDGMTNFGFCSISGIAAYSSWSYEMTRSRSKRNYTLPVYASISFAVFYAANIYNSVNSADRYNLFVQKELMEKIGKRFEMIISDDKLFLQFMF